MNTGIEKTVIQCATCLDYQHTQPQEKPIQDELQEIFGAYIFSIDNETLLFIVNYYNKFPEEG